MTIIDNNAPAANLESGSGHPDWCMPPLCTRRGGLVDEHVSHTGRVNTAFGSALRVGIVAEDHEAPSVLLAWGELLDDPEIVPPCPERFEPEEARLLARRLLEAADAVEALGSA